MPPRVLASGPLGQNPAGAIIFSFQMGRVTCNESCAVKSPSSAYYYEAKIHVQMVSAFHGNQLSRGSSK